MGKITSNTLDDVKVQVPRRSNNTVCGAEVVGFLACLDVNSGNEALCVQQKRSLFDCMEVAMNSGMMQRRHKPATNYHIRMVRAKPLFLPCLRSAQLLLRWVRHLSLHAASPDAPTLSLPCAQFLRSVGAGRKGRK